MPRSPKTPPSRTASTASSRAATPRAASSRSASSSSSSSSSRAASSRAASGASSSRAAAPRGASRSGAASRASGKAPAKRAAAKETKAFLASQRAALLAERSTYLHQAEELKAQADSLALEHEPGDVQFDEEGGEGGTSNVDRELDLVLSAQARAAIEEIDRALAKIDAGTYGTCERCGQPIPRARLEALPHASLCVSCKSGGLSSRR